MGYRDGGIFYFLGWDFFSFSNSSGHFSLPQKELNNKRVGFFSTPLEEGV